MGLGHRPVFPGVGVMVVSDGEEVLSEAVTCTGRVWCGGKLRRDVCREARFFRTLRMCGSGNEDE